MFHDDKGPLEPEYTPFPQTQEERFSDFYETGNIRPPKNHGGWVAAVLLDLYFSRRPGRRRHSHQPE